MNTTRVPSSWARCTSRRRGGTQKFELKTDGWGWQFGGGLEVWPNETFAIYGEFGYTAMKGDDVDGGEAKIDNRVGSIVVGLRVHIGR